MKRRPLSKGCQTRPSRSRQQENGLYAADSESTRSTCTRPLAHATSGHECRPSGGKTRRWIAARNEDRRSNSERGEQPRSATSVGRHCWGCSARQTALQGQLSSHLRVHGEILQRVYYRVCQSMRQAKPRAWVWGVGALIVRRVRQQMRLGLNKQYTVCDNHLTHTRVAYQCSMDVWSSRVYIATMNKLSTKAKKAISNREVLAKADAAVKLLDEFVGFFTKQQGCDALRPRQAVGFLTNKLVQVALGKQKRKHESMEEATEEAAQSLSETFNQIGSRFVGCESELVWDSTNVRFKRFEIQVVWLSTVDLRFKRSGRREIWGSIDFRFIWFEIQLLWESIDLRFSRIEVQLLCDQLVWDSSALRSFWFQSHVVWDSTGLRVKRSGIWLVWDSVD